MTETVFERAKFALGIKTNKELAEKLGQAETTVSGWKSRDTIPVDYLLLISKLSNVPVDWILKGKDSCFPVPKNAIAPKYKSDDDFDAVNEDRIEKHLNMIVFTRAEAIAAGELPPHDSSDKKLSDPIMQGLTEVIDILTRLKNVFNSNNIRELSQHLRVPIKTIDRWINHRFIPYKFLIPIAESANISLDWLLTGKGEMHGGSGGAAEFDGADAVWVPLYDVELSAGSGIEVYGERIIQRVPFAKSWLQGEGLHAGNLACLPVHGDSMEPTLQHGDIVLVNHEKTRGDGVFVIRMGNALRVKRLQWLANGDLRISSDNAIYEPEQVNPDDLGEQFAILAACHTRISRVG